MTEEEFKNFIKESEEERERQRIFERELITARLKIALEGFKSASNEFIVSDELRIYRAPISEREEFYKRTAGPNEIRQKAEDNEFFIVYDFKIPRCDIHGLGPGNKLTLISIFFAVCSRAFIGISKGQFFLGDKEDFESAGLHQIHSIPFGYEKDVKFNESDIQQLTIFWPKFSEQYLRMPHFALVCRRYYDSLNRYAWTDELIDLIIALEALLLPEESKNKGGTIAKRLSKMILKYKDRGTVSKIARECYELRNKVVHGEEISDLENYARAYLKELSSYVKFALQEYLLSHFGLAPCDLVKHLDSISGKPKK